MGLIDATIAEKVMKWERDKSEGRLKWVLDGDITVENFRPTTNMNHAWIVVDKLHEEGHRLLLNYLASEYSNQEEGWHCVFGRNRNIDKHIFGEKEPSMAICKAALVAYGISVY